MDNLTVFPNKSILAVGPVAREFLKLGIAQLSDAAEFVHALPYGYNSDRDDLMILFKEKMGTCSTKHAVMATLARELEIPIARAMGIYAMTEEIVTGTQRILDAYHLPYLPMIHCFLVYGAYRVDLTEGNKNGKNRPLDDFLYTEIVAPTISAKDEYLHYRRALQNEILTRSEMQPFDIKTILHAREKGLALLKANIA
jgi:hypothetical protein